MTTIYLYTNGTQLSEDEQRAARAAAENVFKKYGYTPGECYGSYMPISDDEYTGDERADVWVEAERAAIDAATEGWAEDPEDLSLGLS